MNIVIIDQEVKDSAGIDLSSMLKGYTGPATFHRLVMVVNGELSWLNEEAIPAGATIAGDFNALAARNNKSLSQAWTEGELREFVSRQEARGCKFRTFSNFTFGKGRVEGGPFAAKNLYDKSVSDPEWFTSSTRPLPSFDVLHGTPSRKESAKLHADATWDFRAAEDAQKYGELPVWYAEIASIVIGALTKQEAQALVDWKPKNLEVGNPRRMLAVALSMIDIDGNRRRRLDGSPVSPNYARKRIARLHGQARGVGGPIRACLRSIGRGKDAEKRALADKAYMKAARAIAEVRP